MNCVPIDMFPTQCPLLPTPWAGKSVEVCFTSEHSFMDLRCAMSSRTNECDIIYLCKYIQFKFTSRTRHSSMHFEWNIYTFASNWNHGGISCDVHFAGHLHSNRTNIWSDKNNIRNVQSGAAWGLELRTAGLTDSPCHSVVTQLDHSVVQGSSNLILEGRCSAKFSSNLPQPTCLGVSSMPKSLISCFGCVWLELELNSAGHWPSRTELGDPCCCAW